MIAANLLLAAGAVACSLFATASATSCGGGKCAFRLTREAQLQAAHTYLQTWSGDFALEKTIFEPDVNLFQDRLPGPEGSSPLPIGNSTAFINYMKRAHTGWDHYEFVLDNISADGYNVAVRWHLNATTGPPKKMLLPTTKPQGTHITYNGTDWLQLDACTGRVKQVDSSQDFITELWMLGVPGVKL